MSALWSLGGCFARIPVIIAATPHAGGHTRTLPPVSRPPGRGKSRRHQLECRSGRRLAVERLDRPQKAADHFRVRYCSTGSDFGHDKRIAKREGGISLRPDRRYRIAEDAAHRRAQAPRRLLAFSRLAQRDERLRPQRKQFLLAAVTVGELPQARAGGLDPKLQPAGVRKLATLGAGLGIPAFQIRQR